VGPDKGKGKYDGKTLLHYDMVGLSFVGSEVHDHSSLIPPPD